MSQMLIPEDYVVYTAALLQKSTLKNRERFVVCEEMRVSSLEFILKEGPQSIILHWRIELKGLEAVTAEDFISRNQHLSHLEQKLDLPLPYTLLTKSESNQIWNRADQQTMRHQPMDGWKVFHERYPRSGGVVSFSAVGFNENRTQALVEMGIRGDWLMGRGEMILMSRGESGWKICQTMRLWVS